MKTLLKYVVLFSAAILDAACSDIIESSESVSSPEKEIILMATREGLQPGTRSFRLDDGSVWWNPAEAVSVFYGSGADGGSKFVSMNTAIAETVELQGSVQMAGSGKDFWAVYPYSEDNSCDGSSITTVIPDVQIGVEGNFSGDVFPAVAKSSSMTLAFWNICGGVKFFVSRGDIQSVSFKGNRQEVLAGKVRVSLNAEGIPDVVEVVDGKTEVTLNAPDGGTFKAGKYYYITLLPTALDSGFTMTFSTAAEVGAVMSSNPQSIKRSVFGILKNIDSKVYEWNKIEWVDLGLPSGLKWATCNIGASKPEEYGDYFAWGETEPYYEIGHAQSDSPVWKAGCELGYSWPSYVFELGTDWYGPFSKYVSKPSCGTVDNKTILDPDDDAASVVLGDGWRMPTAEDWTELMENCDWIWTTYNNVPGFRVNSLKASDSNKRIFLPAAGYRYGVKLNDLYTVGHYWSSYRHIDDRAVYFNFSYRNVIGNNGTERCGGLSIRPVYGDRIHPGAVSLSNTSLSLYVGYSEQLTATVLPNNAAEKSVMWSSDNTEVAVVNETGIVKALSPGTATITASAVDGNGTATCVISVEEMTVDWTYIEGTWTAQNYDNDVPDGDLYKAQFKKIDDTTVALINLWYGGEALQGTITFDAATNSATMSFPAKQVVMDASTYGYGKLLLIGYDGGWAYVPATAIVTAAGITLGPWNLLITAGSYAGSQFGSSYTTVFTKSLVVQ